LNQYQSITTSPTRTVVGRAPVADAVTVNGTTLGGSHRTGEVFHLTLPAAANANSPVWQPATVVSQGNSIARAFYHPKAVTAPQHDLDGNLVSDGRWVYSWDAENRLIQMESTAAAVQAGAPYRKLVFRYDAGGRRLAKTVYHGTAAAPVFASSTRWLYDGWNPISEFSGSADTGGTITRTKSYTWGTDLSGTPQGAGGVGGLLAVIVHSGFTNCAYYPSYDGNGNIVAWTLEGTPAPVSRREYDAFGNTLVEQGVAPSAYGFSTKMQDVETGLYYYGYRYYDPVTGRWLSRDPIEERGGINLYGFVGNNSISTTDYLGLIFILDLTGSSYRNLPRDPDANGNIFPPPSNADAPDGWVTLDSPIEGMLGLGDDVLWNALSAIPGQYNDYTKKLKVPRPRVAGSGYAGGPSIGGYIDQDVEVSSSCDEHCCLMVNVKHVVFELVINTNASPKEFAPSTTAAHELAHGRAFYRKLVAMVNHYNARPQPCYANSATCKAKATEWAKELETWADWAEHGEYYHYQNGFGTPPAGTSMEWSGPAVDWTRSNRD
jgi:RHS repeat-associated protein